MPVNYTEVSITTLIKFYSLGPQRRKVNKRFRDQALKRDEIVDIDTDTRIIDIDIKTDPVLV
jgi:hypothetical protein